MQYLLNINSLPAIENKIIYFYSSKLEYHEKFKKMISNLEMQCNFNFFAINIESDINLIKRFDLKSIPSIIIFNKNKINKIEGLISFKNFCKKITIN